MPLRSPKQYDALSHCETLERFLQDARLDIGNNTVERAIRPPNDHPQGCALHGFRCGGRSHVVVADAFPQIGVFRFELHRLSLATSS
jgi:Transposase IS66 family